MQDQPRNPKRQILPASSVWTRYGVSNRTIDRWLACPKLAFPRPIVINRRRYWDEAELNDWERRRATTPTASQQ